MRRYWIPLEAIQKIDDSEEVELRGEILHHIRDVCRMHKGSKFEVLSEDGKARLVEIIEEQKKISRARVLETREVPALPLPEIHLAISIPRFPVFEAVIEKAVELGVHSIHPFFSEFSFVRKQEDILEKKQERWQKIVLSATQQSGRGELLKIQRALPLEKLLSEFNRTGLSTGLFAYEGEGQMGLQAALEPILHQDKLTPLEQMWIFVGSEGGFSPREVELFQTFKMKPVTLGAQVLRVETACVALLSVIKYVFDQMR
jgi:16S rRNA (uracil1498-N3)-methyltransferase